MDYDQSILYPIKALDSIVSFLGLKPDGDAYQNALSFNNGGIGYNTTIRSD
jgi:hypothetical protein